MSLASDVQFPSQADLPPLPLPTLSDTCERYLKSVRPLLSDEEFAHTEAIVADFCREGGEGEALQQFLEEKASSERNWMEEWWEQLAYLRTRTTMAVHINWLGQFPELMPNLDVVTTAALVLDGLLTQRLKINQGRFPLETIRGNPLDMHQFSRVYGMSRLPCEGADELVQKSEYVCPAPLPLLSAQRPRRHECCSSAEAASLTSRPNVSCVPACGVHSSTHVAILRDGAVIIVHVCDPSGAPLPTAQLKALIAATLAATDSYAEDQASEQGQVLKDGGCVGRRCNVSLLTALNRDKWAAERAVLLAEPTSAASLQLVESSLFCIALMRECPTSKEEIARLSHCGDGRDKWFDKVRGPRRGRARAPAAAHSARSGAPTRPRRALALRVHAMHATLSRYVS